MSRHKHSSPDPPEKKHSLIYIVPLLCFGAALEITTSTVGNEYSSPIHITGCILQQYKYDGERTVLLNEQSHQWISYILAMNAFPVGTRVFFWGAQGNTLYGTVQSTSRAPDGSLYLTIRVDNGSVTTLPAAGVNKVQ